MEPKDFARVILRRKRTVITAIIVVALTSFLGSVRKAPQYVAECDVLFKASAYDPTDPSSRPIETVGSLQSNAQIMQSPAMTDRAAAIANLPGSQVGGKLNVEILQDTQVFRLRVVDGEAVRAGQICNAYGEAYIAFKREEAEREYRQLLAQIDVAQRETTIQLRDLQERLNEAVRRGRDEQIDLTVQRDSLLFERSDRTKQRAQIANLLEFGITGGPELIKPSGGGVQVGGNVRRDLGLGVMVGLMFGIGIALVREYLDDTVRDKESTQRELGIPVLAAIPDDGFDGYEPSEGTIEAARQLRATLASLGFPHERSVLVITSTISKTRTTTLASLAAAVAESGRSVLVIGSDMRSARTHEAFGVANTVGLANVARGEVPLERAIRPAPGIEGVYVLPAGPLVGNPGELLSSEEMAFVLRRARRWADVVLLDAPPVLAAADASVLGAYADGVLLVVSAGRTNRSHAAEAKEQLVAAGARLLGAVMVGVEEGGRQSQHYVAELPALVPMGGAWGAYDADMDWAADDSVLTATARTVPRTGARRSAQRKKTAAEGVRSKPRRKVEPRVESPKKRARSTASRSARTTSAKQTTAKRTTAGKRSTPAKRASTARSATARRTTATRRVTARRR